MSPFAELVHATLDHVRQLKAQGVRYLRVDSGVLENLRQPINGSQEAPAPGLSPSERQESPAQNSITINGTRSGIQPGAEENTDAKRQAMEELRQRASVCQKCPNLASARKNVVFGVGDINSTLMFVGEAPGADEDAQGEPFVGAAGQLLTRIIQTMGYSRETVYIANILKCRPDTPGQTSGNRKPTPEEMKTCLPYLLAQIDLIKPRVMVALGATAIEGLFGKHEGVARMRGQFKTFRGIPVMPTFHPAYLLRNEALREKRKVWEDMLRVLEKLEVTVTEKQRGYFLKS